MNLIEKNRLLFVIELVARFVDSFIPPIIFQKVIDFAVLKLPKSISFSFLYYGISIGSFTVLLITGILNHRIWPNFYVKRIKSTLSRALHDFLKRFHSGRLLSIVMGDTRVAVTRHEIWIVMLYERILRVFVVLAILFYLVGMKYFAMSVAFLFVLSTLSWLNSRIAYEPVNDERKNLEREFMDFLMGAKDIAGIGVFDDFYNLKSRVERYYIKVHMKYSIKTKTISFFSDLSASIYTIFLLFNLIVDLFTGRITVGTYFMVWMYSELIVDPVQALFKLIEARKAIKVSEKKIKELTREVESQKISSGIEEPSKVSIKVKNLSFSYGEREFLKNISFEASKGEVVWIRGKSGSGKTTLVKLLCGLLKPKDGIILIGDKELNKLSENYIQDKLKVLFQDSSHVAASVRVNVDFMRNLPESEIRGVLKLAGLDEIELSRELTEGSGVSGGQLRRILLARTIAKKPDILILDEPFVGLDKESKEIVFELVKLLKRESLIIVVSHDESFSKVASKIVELPDLEAKD